MSVLEGAVEKFERFVDKEHLVNVLKGEWVRLRDESGSLIKGMRGRAGAVAIAMDGLEIGVDVIQMDQGTAFPLHVHPGDHILYVLSGVGYVHIDGRDVFVEEGHSIFIPGDYPHGVRTHGYVHGDTGGEPLTFLAFGHPHKSVDATDRMAVHPDNVDTYEVEGV